MGDSRSIQVYKYIVVRLYVVSSSWASRAEPRRAGWKFQKVKELTNLGFLTVERSTNKRRLTTIQIPVSMSSMDKNTAENQCSVMLRVMQKIPELKAFQKEFPTQCRFAVVDRFGANTRGEEFLDSHDPDNITTIFGCEVHKAAGSLKRALAVEDNTISGVVNVGLALEGAGTLQTLRAILQDIFRTDLIVVFDEPPGGHVVRHRKAILNMFLPLSDDSDQSDPGKYEVFQVQARKRRFILSVFANSDLSSREIVHFCAWGCCSSPEQSLQYFERYVTWALLPKKCGVLSRKSWTGADHCLDWCGLLQSHWGLLTRVIERFVGNPQADPVASRQGHDASSSNAHQLAFQFDSV